MPPRECLAWHVVPRLDGGVESAGTPGQYRARCPAHDDRKASLAIRDGTRGRRIIWRCHAGCNDAEVRVGMVRAGVPDGCLPRVSGQRTEDELVSAILAIFDTLPAGRERELTVLEAVTGKPRNRAALAALAERFGIDRATAYRVTALSHDATDGTATGRLGGLSHGATDRRMGRHSRDASTGGFGPSRLTGAEYAVSRETPQGAALGVRQCEWCGSPIPSRMRADSRFCLPAHRKAAWRDARRKAGE